MTHTHQSNPGHASPLDTQVAEWRRYVERRRPLDGRDVDELEQHVRDEVNALQDAGLSDDEAFLVAVKRLGSLDALSREFAREHSDRLWKQLVLGTSDDGHGLVSSFREAAVVLGLACAAALAVKLPDLAGLTSLDGAASFYARHISLLVLPWLTGYFIWKRGLSIAAASRLLPWFAAAAGAVNAVPFADNSDTLALTALHLPIALWLVVGAAYVGGRWFGASGRMNFVRFSGEMAIYYVLIALGGGVFTGSTLLLFEAIGVSAEWLAQDWIIPCGAAGAVLVAAWLVESKQTLIESMAPVLTRLFTPLFSVLLLVFLGTMAWTGRPIDVAREVLIGFDLLLALVVGLVLYAIASRDPQAPPGLWDALQLLLIVSALAADGLALAAISTRLSTFGITPNRMAALGENLILLVNLAGTAWLYVRLLRGRVRHEALERWQVRLLPVYALWAAAVAVVFPVIFGGE